MASAPDEPSLISRSVEALTIELDAARRRRGNPISLRNGHRVESASDGATFVFEIAEEVELADGLPAELTVGAREFRSEILRKEAERLLLFVSTVGGASLDLVGTHVPRADLRLAPWFLLEELRARLRDLAERERLSAPAHHLLARFASPLASPLNASRLAPPDNGGPAIDMLNARQRRAVDTCRSAQLHFVWGPPGTGKTSTLGALVSELMASGRSVLVCAQSNVAVDAALLATLRRCDMSDTLHAPLEAGALVRAGFAALPEAKLRNVTAREIAAAQNPDVARRLDEVQKRFVELAAGNRASAASIGLREEIRDLRRRMREVEQRLLREASVVFCTLSKLALAPEVHGRRFDHAIVDEASMAYPAQVLLSAAAADHGCAVFGDFRQLAPIVQSDDPTVRRTLGRDVFNLCGLDRGAPRDSAFLTMLTTQYRMHPRIRAAVSRFAYHDRLEDGETVAADTRPFAAAAPLPNEPFVYLNSRRLGHRGMQSGQFQRWSRINPVSAAWAVRVAAEMVQSLPTPSDEVAILSPYRDQTRLIWSLLRAAGLRGRARAGTVHAFQGSQRAGIVLDLVDAPPQGVPGRLLSGENGSRLLTVGASRAQGKLVVLADPELRKGVGAKLLENAMEWRPQTHELAWSSSSTSAPHDLTFYPTLETALADLERDLLGSEFYAWGDTSVVKPLSLLDGATKDGPAGQFLACTEDTVWCVARKPHGGETVWRVESDGVADSLAQTLGGSSLRRSLRRDHGSSSSNRAAAFEDAELRRLAALPADSVQCPFCKSYFSLSLETCPVCSQPYPRPMRGRGREKRTTIATGRPQSVTPQKFGSSIPKPPAPWRARLGVVVIEGHEEGSITEMDDEGALVQFVTYRQRYRWLEFIHIKDVGRVPLRR